MFEDYHNYVKFENELNQKYESLKKELSILIRENIVDIITDYDHVHIVDNINLIVEMIHRYNKIDQEHQQELNKTKQKFLSKVGFFQYLYSRL
jgi:hypothetical protein